MIPEELETQIAEQTEAGRESLAVWRRVNASLTGEQRLMKAFELTENTRQLMRAGIRYANPDATEEQLDRMVADRLLSFHGFSRSELDEALGGKEQPRAAC